MLLTRKEDLSSPYYANLHAQHFSPGWARPAPSMWAEPKPRFKPAVWRFAQAKQALDASHNMVPADQTERRNLIMVNPIEGNTYASTRHLVAAYQCVMAGDRARTHRHSANALRLVLKGKPGIATIVNGTSIVRETDVSEVFTYYHVECDGHELIFAEGVPAETFVDNVERMAFDNWEEHQALYPQGKTVEELPYPRAKALRQVPQRARTLLAQRGERLYGGALQSVA